jgi:hypothetical protein
VVFWKINSEYLNMTRKSRKHLDFHRSKESIFSFQLLTRNQIDLYTFATTFWHFQLSCRRFFPRNKNNYKLQEKIIITLHCTAAIESLEYEKRISHILPNDLPWNTVYSMFSIIVIRNQLVSRSEKQCTICWWLSDTLIKF